MTDAPLPLIKKVDPNGPLQWIGAYAAAASLIWDIALVADIVHSIHHRKLWFPCRYSALNAASLTVLAVAVKFAMDLTTPILGDFDQLAKMSCAAFLCASTTHFMPSVGSMTGRGILVNLAALGILIMTLAVNVMIQVSTGIVEDWMSFKAVVIVVLNVYSFMILSSSSLTIFAIKKYLKQSYNELYKRIPREELQRDDIMNIDKLKLCLKKYSVIAESRSPQHVMSRWEACAVLCIICLASCTLVILLPIYGKLNDITSDYKWSVYFVYWAQYIGLVLCAVMSLGRFIHQIVPENREGMAFRISLEIHNYRIKRLVEWKKRPPPLFVRGQKLRKFIFDIGNLLLNICIGNQVVVAVVNKTFLSIPLLFYSFLTHQEVYVRLILIMLSILLFFCIWAKSILRFLVTLKKKVLREPDASVDPNGSIEMKYIRLIYSSIDSSIKVGAKHQPRGLIELLENSTSFNGVLKFESDQVSPMIHQESPNCWSLSLATLTIIMIALPNIQNGKRKQLLQSVTEGFKYVHLVERSLDVHKKLASSRKAADYAWVVAELRQKWLDMDLTKIAKASQSSRETLQTFSRESEKILMEFSQKENVMESHVNLPENIIIAHSMYKISSTLLLEFDECHNLQSEAKVFEKLVVIIADIFAACFTNLPDVIIMKCNESSIEESEKSIWEAICLLGETQDILKNLQKREIPYLSPDQSVYIDKWCAILGHTNHGSSGSTSSNDNPVPTSSSEVHLDIKELSARAREEALEIEEDNAETGLSGESEFVGEKL